MTVEKKLDNALFIAWAAALVATLGSLFFSEVMLYPPCELCWYQRVFMYPMSIILLVAIWKKDFGVSKYMVTASAVGWIIALYHTLLQWVPALQENVIGCGAIPCTTDYIDWLGFITIPLMSLIAYSIIVGCGIYMVMLQKNK